MDLIADIFLLFGALGASFYCMVLSRRLTRFTDLEQGIGGAVAVLSVQVDDLKAALAEARDASSSASNRLEQSTSRAEELARRLEQLSDPTAAEYRVSRIGDGLQTRSIRRRRRGTDHAERPGDAA